MAVLARAPLLVAACFRAVSSLSLWTDGEGTSNLSEATEELRVNSTSCAIQTESDNLFMSDIVRTVGMGDYSADTATAWRAYQDKLTQKLLSEHPDKNYRKRPFKILVVSAVHDTVPMVEIFEANMNRLMANKAGDKFDFALFHLDSTTTVWKKQRWYRKRRGPVVMKTLGAGCKPMFWAQITPKIASQYDYLWLLDEDIRVDFMNWDFYRTVLATINPMVSQPVIIPKEPNKRSTGVTRLVMQVPKDNKFTMAYETQRSEVQAPVISTKIWAAIHERNMANDRRNDWYIDDFWDAVAFLAEAKCKMTGVLAVNAAPVRHMDCHNLFKGTKCVEGCGDAGANCLPVSGKEESLVWDAMKSVGCDVPKDWATICENKPIHDCHTDLWARSRRQSWSAPLSA